MVTGDRRAARCSASLKTRRNASRHEPNLGGDNRSHLRGVTVPLIDRYGPACATRRPAASATEGLQQRPTQPNLHGRRWWQRRHHGGGGGSGRPVRRDGAGGGGRRGAVVRVP